MGKSKSPDKFLLGAAKNVKSPDDFRQGFCIKEIKKDKPMSKKEKEDFRLPCRSASSIIF